MTVYDDNRGAPHPDAHPEWHGPDKGTHAGLGLAVCAVSAAIALTFGWWAVNALWHAATVSHLLAKYN
jgi:hypothetical protein